MSAGRAAWAADFTYDYYRKILQAVRSRFSCLRLSEAGAQSAPKSGRPRVILRHDIDIDLARALEMAKIDAEENMPACYMVMVNSPLYSIAEQDSRKMIREIRRLGHEIALHFDFDSRDERTAGRPMGEIEASIKTSSERLEEIAGAPVRSVSFHRPLSEFLRGPMFIAGRVNAYAEPLMNWYLSDSRGSWREGEPVPRLLNPDRPLLQLLTHPIWWGETHRPAEDRLEEFFDEQTRGRPPEWVQRFDEALAGHFTIQRRGRR